jgi:catechol 2,3-dioxygenase-like lactoylglutathione lyase family enzyme
MGVVQYNHTGQCVRDLARTERFYIELLGFERVLAIRADGEPSSTLLRLPGPLEMEVVYLRREGFVLELLHLLRPAAEPHRPRAMNEPGLTHISLTVDDLDETLGKVAEYGGRVLSETRLPGAIFIEDPEGQLLELLDQSSKLVEMVWKGSPP